MNDLRAFLESKVVFIPGSHDRYSQEGLRGLDLSQLFKAEYEHIWIGNFPPFLCNSLNLRQATGYRASAVLHGRNDVVWCVVPESYDETDWPIVLDEALRLLRARGYMVLRIPHHFSQMAKIKSYLTRKFGFSIRIVDEVNLPSGLFSIMEVERVNFNASISKTWTIGILASGKRDGIVKRMLQELHQSSRGREIEVLIFGPVNPELIELGGQYLREEDFGINQNLNEISRKKNAIAQVASGDNLLICHDRYFIGPDFFDSFNIFGYDFDLMTVNQTFEDGQIFPGLGFINGLELDCLQYISNVSDYVDGCYINGGLIIAKRVFLEAIPLSNLCFWNQAEDGEFSVIARQRGVIPRYNSATTVMTAGVGKAHCSQFRDRETGNFILQNQNRAALRTGCHYKWVYDTYEVSEVDARLEAGKPVNLVVYAAPDNKTGYVNIELHVEYWEHEKLFWRSSEGGWRTAEKKCDNDSISLTLAVNRGEATVQFRAGPVTTNLRDSSRPRQEVPTSIRLALTGVRDLRPLLLEFLDGDFGFEHDGGTSWWWLGDKARIGLLNPNPFPVYAVWRFNYRHVKSSYHTSLAFHGGKTMELVAGVPDEIRDFCIPVLLAPGMISCTLTNDALLDPTPVAGDVRALSICIINPVLESDFLMDSFNVKPEAEWSTGTEASRKAFEYSLLVGKSKSQPDPLYCLVEIDGPVGIPLEVWLNGRLYAVGTPVARMICLCIDGNQQDAYVEIKDSEGLTLPFRPVKLGSSFGWYPHGVAQPIERFGAGSVLKFTSGDRLATSCLGDGWSKPEDHGTWMVSRHATISLPLNWPTDEDLMMEMTTSTFVVPEIGHFPVITLRAGNIVLAEWQSSSRDCETHMINVPAEVIVEQKLKVEFEISKTISPAMAGESVDGRNLGVKIIQISLQEAEG